MNDDARVIVEWDADFHRMYEGRGVKITYQPWEFHPEVPIVKEEA
jgi:hypothetical protein